MEQKIKKSQSKLNLPTGQYFAHLNSASIGKDSADNVYLQRTKSESKFALDRTSL